ncbi:ATP-dependent RNA helicase DDX24 [Agrilus planipennis]|uniref:ATP-dependent RNA helicase n=1 Tax=Agrilus planipennis TaxID=224129 RepID=A0A1W4XTB4_AGRPL|nr:ATP-dependent RNA helicase DDX24 [Agrilus planipennis]
MKGKRINWKPVELDQALFSNGIPEGLVAIEECTDYDLNVFQSQPLETKKRKNVEQRYANKKKPKLLKSFKSACENDLDLIPSKCGSTFIESSAEDEEVKNMEAWHKFGLQESLIKALADQNFLYPTHIQALTLPSAILGKKDILGAAETGSGKTLAFGLPILSGILKRKELLDHKSSDEFNPLNALILTPTRELAIQVKNHLTAAAKYTDIKIAVVVGGMSAEKQERLLSKNPEIVVATPGRLWELIQLGNSHLSSIDKIRFLAIDETDRMLERGHFQELHDILEKINLMQNEQKNRQNFVFSATLTLEHELPKHLLLKRGRKINKSSSEYKLKKIIELIGMTNPKVVDITDRTGKTVQTLTECRISCSIDEKDYYIYYFLKKYPGRTLIFCNSIGCVKRLNSLLSVLQINVLPLHASMQQRQRLKNLDRFRDDPQSILIATDVAARGLDIPSVDHVLHYQMPRTSESYVHRSGRTARASKDGITVLLIDPSELQSYLRLCRTLGKGEDMPLFPVQQNILAAVKQRVNLAREVEKLELQNRKKSSEKGWLQKAADDMDIILDDDLVKEEEDNFLDSANSLKYVQKKRKQLADLLNKPVFTIGFSGKYPTLMNASNLLLIEENDKAINVAKNAAESKTGRLKAKWLFKKGNYKSDEKGRKKTDNKNIQKRKKKTLRDKQSSKNKIYKFKHVNK